jgi:hypothetical protein
MIHHLIHVLWKICCSAAKNHYLLSMLINTRNQFSIINNASVLIELAEKNSTQITESQITELKVGQSVFCPLR